MGSELPTAVTPRLKLPMGALTTNDTVQAPPSVAAWRTKPSARLLLLFSSYVSACSAVPLSPAVKDSEG